MSLARSEGKENVRNLGLWSQAGTEIRGRAARGPQRGVRLGHRCVHTQSQSLTLRFWWNMSADPFWAQERRNRLTGRTICCLFRKDLALRCIHRLIAILCTLKICHISQCIQSETPCKAVTHAMSNYVGSPRTSFFQALSHLLISNKVWNDKTAMRVPIAKTINSLCLFKPVKIIVTFQWCYIKNG